MNLSQAMQVMVRTHVAALHANTRANAIELKSGPGVGKSSTVEQVAMTLAATLGEPVGIVVDMLATKQSPDILGFGLPTKPVNPGDPMEMIFSRSPWFPKRNNTRVFLPDGTMVDKYGWEGEIPRVGILFLDEWGQAEDDVKKAAAELLLNGEVGDTRLPQGWRVIAASNRLTDRAGVLRSLTFITNRRMELSIDAHLPTWNAWVSGLRPESRPHHLTVSFANKSPDLVFRDAVPPGDAPFCTPRTLVLMDRDLRALRSDEDTARDRLPMDGVAREVCAGWIGGGESAQYFTHVKFAEELPDIADIVADPARAKLPAKIDAQMVCAFMLAHNLTQDNAHPMMRYITRLNIEMQTLAVKTMTSQKELAKLIANEPLFTKWLTDNKDILIAAYA
jgi:hypothetical protein